MRHNSLGQGEAVEEPLPGPVVYLVRSPHHLLLPWRLNVDLLTRLHIGAHRRAHIPVDVQTWWGHCRTEIELLSRQQPKYIMVAGAMGAGPGLQILVGPGVTKGRDSEPWLGALNVCSAWWAHAPLPTLPQSPERTRQNKVFHI